MKRKSIPHQVSSPGCHGQRPTGVGRAGAGEPPNDDYRDSAQVFCAPHGRLRDAPLAVAPHMPVTTVRAMATVGLVLIVALLTGCSTTPHFAGGPYTNYAVATDHIVASEAGAEMLARGGNAVDAAVAASFTLSVVRPFSCGIGGGGFMLIADPNSDPTVLNYRETSPAAVGPDYYTTLNDPAASRFGGHAAGVPGTVAGLLHALETYGTLDRATVLAPAIRAAEDGFAADNSFMIAMEDLRQRREEHPHIRDASDYLWTQLCHSGTLRLGGTITNPDHADALRLITTDGAAAFYDGPIADAIVRAMDAFGGAITRDDLRGYTIDTRAPLQSSFYGRKILTMPPPSSGGIAMQQIFGIIERLHSSWGAPEVGSPAYVHLVAEAMKHAFADRAEHLADDRFINVPTAQLTSPAYLDDLAAKVQRNRTLDTYTYGSVSPAPEDGGTSHISIIDASGMAVACTETINLRFGSLVVVPGYGFALNNEMDDFTTVPGAPNAFGLQQSDRNLPAPGKRPLSSMSPIIVLDDSGEAELVAGASGGPRIITGTTQVVLNAILFDDTPEVAVSRKRFHHQWLPPELRFEENYEPNWPRTHTAAQLRKRGHTLGDQKEVGIVQIITAEADGLHAASDPRKGGAPAGD